MARPSIYNVEKTGQVPAPNTKPEPRTKKGYRNYVKGDKTWLEEWTSEGRLNDEIAADAFDNITDQTPLALRALTAYKCEHLGRGFASAEGLRSAFKDYFERLCDDHLYTLDSFKDVKLHMRSKTGIPYHEFVLIFRKTNKDPIKVQKYMVQIDTAHPEIDCYTHVGTWKTHMEKILGRPLAESDFVFPAIASTGQLKFEECTSRTAFKTLLDEVVDKLNVMQGHNGKFMTHCFCRGRAQYRFLWADRKWTRSLKAVKWGGGWSSNENVGTVMHYLLGEWMAYEEGFSDIMMDDHAIDHHETFVGEDETAPVCRAYLLKFEDTILVKIQGLIAGAAATSANIYVPPTQTQSNGTDNDADSTGICNIPHGSPEKGLIVPLKDWTMWFKSSEYAMEVVKFGNIRFVCEEFRVQCDGDHGEFEAKFPGLCSRFTMLMKAVRAERKIRGDTKSRTSSK
ncbi:hypothetical protein C8R44DRAFT_736834 [Mycena epipterygia]|nr:hypothetical protein C8R44DRAFT_736834 [Mycena epipterygia]